MALDVFKHVRSRFGHLFEDVCGFIVRPERAEYSLLDLGPRLFRLGENLSEKYKRTDFELLNMRGMKVQCSWFEPDTPTAALQSCVVYLHGNCGSRCDGLEVLFLLKHGFSLFVYDACGSGLSDGQYVSLGFYERQDLAAVIEYLHSSGRVKAIGLWGRSMGAVTSIMYASRDPSIQCIVADSPFANLRQLCGDLVAQHGGWVPTTVVKAVVKRIRKKICSMAGFDINDLDSLKYAALCEVPAFMFHGRDDTFVTPKHSIAVSNAYAGSCIHKVVDGDHNSRRGPDVLETAVAFLQLYLNDKVDAAIERRKVAAERNPEVDQVSHGPLSCDSADGDDEDNSSDDEDALDRLAEAAMREGDV